jgi:Tn3 transposase DDE domain
MHSLSKVNFAILHWFGPRYEPRFTDLNVQLGEIYCAADSVLHVHCLIQPSGRIDLPTILDGKENIDYVVATLGLKEITQGSQIR